MALLQVLVCLSASAPHFHQCTKSLCPITNLPNQANEAHPRQQSDCTWLQLKSQHQIWGPLQLCSLYTSPFDADQSLQHQQQILTSILGSTIECSTSHAWRCPEGMCGRWRDESGQPPPSGKWLPYPNHWAARTPPCTADLAARGVAPACTQITHSIRDLQIRIT